MEVEEHAAACARDDVQRAVALRGAVAALAAERVSRETLGMDAHVDVFAVADVAHHERDVTRAVDERFVRMTDELAEARRHLERRDALHEFFVTHAVCDEVLDGHELEAMFGAEQLELRPAHHPAVVVENFADDAGGIEACEPRQVDRRFGLTGAHEHAAVAGAKRKRVAGRDEVGRK